MLTKEQKKIRRSGLGGSDAAAAVGLSPWTTPLQLYLDKTEGQDQDENTDMYRGRLLEPVVRQMYCDETGRTVIVPDQTIRHPKHEFLLASLDGKTPDETIIFEGKTARDKRGWGDPGTADVPVVYLCQAQHYMMVAGIPRVDMAVLFGANFEFAIYPIEADAEFQDLLLEGERRFWECVLKRQPPDPTTSEDLRRRWPIARPATNLAKAPEIDAARVLVAVKKRIKELETMEVMATDAIKRAIADAEALEFDGEQLATWKNIKANPRFDAKRFQAENPDLYAQYLTEPPPQRRFYLKGNHPCLAALTETETITLPAPSLSSGPTALPAPA
ncbi:MAG: lambda-exonuclease family protein [Pseudomonadota bacterium]